MVARATGDPAKAYTTKLRAIAAQLGERILVHELGSQTDYETTYGSLPFGLLVRRVAKLDHAAAMAAFAEFVNAHTLNQTQIGFLHTVIDYIEHNGYLDPEQLAKPPFDHPRPMLKLFDTKQAMDLILCIRKVRDNAMPPEQTHIGALAG
nr:type I restriction-modification enzyme R subunit C-terminal domain-containing protein [Bifidobacterium miconis]